jgi:cysteine desulfurase
LGIHADEIVFTGSATESANLALLGAAEAWQQAHPGRVAHIVVSAIEHDAVLEPARKLEKKGVRVTRLPVDARGIVSARSLKSVIDIDTVLISVMYANNEIGTIQPIADIAKVIRKWKKEERKVTRIGKPEGDEQYPLLHTDATQAANYCDMHIPRLGVDMLTMNAAKIYGPKGIGLLALLRDTSIEPMLLGGGQEHGRRAGTENVSGIVGLAEAFRIAREIVEDESARLTLLRDYAMSELKKIPGLVVNGDERERLPNNVNFSLPHVDHEFLALQLDAKDFAVATKSACNETDTETSHVLQALREADGTNGPASGIRLSFGRETTKKDIDALTATF